MEGEGVYFIGVFEGLGVDRNRQRNAKGVLDRGAV